MNKMLAAKTLSDLKGLLKFTRLFRYHAILQTLQAYNFAMLSILRCAFQYSMIELTIIGRVLEYVNCTPLEEDLKRTSEQSKAVQKKKQTIEREVIRSHGYL